MQSPSRLASLPASTRSPLENRINIATSDSEQGAQASGLDLSSVVRALRKHWPVVLSVTAIVGIAVTFYTLGQKKIYSASSTVMFDPSPPRPLGHEVQTAFDLNGLDYWTNQEYYATQLEIMKSKRTAMAVVEQLRLHEDPAFLQNAPPGARTTPATASVEDAAAVLLSRVTITPVKNTRLATLEYQDANPERAQRIALAMVDIYVSKNVEDSQASTSSAVDWLNAQLDKLKTNLDGSEMALHQFQLEKNTLALDISAQSSMLREEMTTFDQALTAARIKRVELSARYRELMKVDANDPSNIPATELLNNSLLTTLRSNYIQAKRDREMQVAAGKGDNHPDVRVADAQLTVAKEALLAEIKNVQGSIAKDLAAVTNQEAGLSGLIEATKKQALDVNLLGIEYNRLVRTKENNEKLYEIVLARAKEGDLTRMMQINNIRVVDRPILPKQPVRPRVVLNIAGGFGVGLALGVLGALALFLLDRSVKTQADVETLLGLNFLGILPVVGGDRPQKSKYYGRYRSKPAPPDAPPELIAHLAPLSGSAEAARTVRTNIQFMSPDRPFRSLLVTSAGPSEGKTTVACTLAIAIAQAGQRVCLVDCDLRRPRLHRIFEKSSDMGLSMALLDPKMITDELLETQVPGLSVLPAGPIPPNPAELLQSEKFAELLAGLMNRFDRVVVDSPPVGPVADAAILSTQVDGTVLVIRAGVASRDIVREATRAIAGVGGRVVGAILNSVDVRRGDYGGYRYAYYRKGYYHRDSSPGEEAGEAPVA